MGPLVPPIHAEAIQAGDARGVPAAFVCIDAVVGAVVRVPNSNARTHDDGGTAAGHIHVICRSEGNKRDEASEGWEAHLGLRRAEELVSSARWVAREPITYALDVGPGRRTLVFCFGWCFLATE